MVSTRETFSFLLFNVEEEVKQEKRVLGKSMKLRLVAFKNTPPVELIVVGNANLPICFHSHRNYSKYHGNKPKQT